MCEDLKKKSIKGVLWSFIESISLKLIQFILNVVMARLLLPEDYGIIAIILVFITISQIFIDGGVATALIQEKNKTERDYSTVFSFNIVVSILCYLIIYGTAPFISKFYNTDITLYLRIQSIGIIIYSFSAIHRVRMTVDVNFKSIAKVTLISAIISGIVGIILAYNGFGVWALISQYLTSAIMTTVLFTVLQRWKPICLFDLSSFKRLFSFGARLLGANIIDRIYMNMYPILIGKFYTSSQLGYFSRAEQFSALPSTTCSDVFMRVTYPIMSTINEETELVKVYRKFISLSSYIIFPIILAVILLAKPIVLILLTEKWKEIIPLVQILCFGTILDHISAINRNMLYVKGRADLALRLEVIKKITAIFILFVSLPFGLIGLCAGKALYGLLAMLLNSAYTKKLINVSIMEQIKDFSPSLIMGIIGVLIAAIPIYSFNNIYMQLLGGSLIFVVSYILLSIITKDKSYKEVVQIIRNKNEFIKK